MPPNAWHALSADEVLARLDASPAGLPTPDARRRLAETGPNALLVAAPRSAWSILVDQCRSLLVGLLAAAAVVSWAVLEDVLDAAAILAVLLVDVVIGFLTEWRARRSMEALRSLDVPRARVVRDGGEPVWIDARELVPGDVVDLEPGAAVPADLRIIESSELSVNEAALTGESFPVDKRDEAVEADTPLADRRGMLHKGTLVAAGTGRGVVVATGMATEVGRISELVQETEDDETPLERRLDALGRRLVWLALGVAALVAGIGALRGGDLWLMVETGIALAVAAVPEGLPVVATITLAVGMRRMARHRALVRRLPAVEALGAVTVVCTDKTGTLTRGEMTVTRLVFPSAEVEVTGTGHAPEGRLLHDGRDVDVRADGEGLGAVVHDVLRVAALCNGASLAERDGGWVAEGDPTETALLTAAGKAGLERAALLEAHPELGEVPFSSERMFMATFHEDGAGGVLACVKGAPERVLARCTSVRDGAGARPLDDAGRAELAALNDALADRGLRVLAVAQRRLPAGGGPALDEEAVADLEFLAFTGSMDPPAEGVRETVAVFAAAGVRTVMITGDQPRTAGAVARDLGILTGDATVVDGTHLARLDDEELTDLAARAAVFSRTAPVDKLRIVRGLRARGEVVGMLGDGVNDAAALKGADVGVAMGVRGTDVAKETADVVLADDRLQTVAAAIEGGRVIDDDIRKFIFYLFSCNLSEVLVLLVAGVFGMPLPLLPLQILWLNLVTDVFPALALAMEPAEPDVMERPPADPSAAILSKRFASAVSVYALLMTLPTLAVFVWALRDGDVRRAGTLAFLTLAAAQILHAFNARARGRLRASTWASNRWMLGAVALCVVLAGVVIWIPPLDEVLALVPVTAGEVGLVLAAAAVPLVVGQIVKSRRRSEAPS